MRILVVEDEEELRELIVEGLTIDGYAVDSTGDGADAQYMASVEPYDLILLDLNLPNLDGLKILEEIRRKNQEVKILILSARSQIFDKVNGLDLGANDYLTKPFHFDELEARIRSLLRRSFKQHNTIILCGQIKLDTSKRKVYADNQFIHLTKKEFALLEYFMLNQNRIIGQSELIEHVWDASVNTFSNAIRVHIASLRKKLRNKIHYDPIKNKVGQGYMLENKDG